jgi:hypothetical protein
MTIAIQSAKAMVEKGSPVSPAKKKAGLSEE